MNSDAVIKNEGMRVLAERLGLVEAERFIALMQREAFDYTKWQRELYKDMPLDDLLQKAADFRKSESEQ